MSSKAASVGASKVHGPGERRVASSPAVWRRGSRRVKRPSAARVVRRSASGAGGGDGVVVVEEEDEAKSWEMLPPAEAVADGGGRRKAVVMVVVVVVVRARTRRRPAAKDRRGGLGLARRRISTAYPPLPKLLACVVVRVCMQSMGVRSMFVPGHTLLSMLPRAASWAFGFATTANRWK